MSVRSMAHVLIVDDERELGSLLEYNLREAGFSTSVVHTGLGALSEVERRPPQLILLDLNLPDVPGTEVCRRLRAGPRGRELLIVMLTARGAEPDRVEGFEVGADDYVTKPFSVRELLLRLKAVLRRGASPTPVPQGQVTIGRLQLDAEAHRVRVDDQEIPLTTLEFRLLQHLMGHAGKVQSRERLLEEVWGTTGDLGSRTLDTHVMRLREKLKDARDYVETVRGVGYRLAAAPPPFARD